MQIGVVANNFRIQCSPSTCSHKHFQDDSNLPYRDTPTSVRQLLSSTHMTPFTIQPTPDEFSPKWGPHHHTYCLARTPHLYLPPSPSLSSPHTQRYTLTWSRVLAHSDMPAKSFFCAAASNFCNSLFSRSERERNRQGGGGDRGRERRFKTPKTRPRERGERGEGQGT